MDTTENNVKKIFDLLLQYGFDKKFVQNVLLPDWWSDNIAESKAGFLQTISIIAKNIGADLNNLLSDKPSISLNANIPIKFKTARNVNIKESYIWPKTLALRIPELIEETYGIAFNGIPGDPAVIRSEILKSSKVINLNSLLDYLWQAGIPVLHISEFPKEARKMDGMSINIKGRPVIITSKNHKQDAWLLFIIAHELGHIIKGHLSNSEKVIYDTDFETLVEDNEEKQANETAAKLLTGIDNPVLIKEKITSAFRLSNLAKAKSKELKLDAGTIVLNYAYLNKKYPLAQQALKILSPEADAVALVKQKMKQYLQLENLTEENYGFFSKITSLIEG